MISDAGRDNLNAFLATVLTNLGCHANLINSVEDHVHILFELGRTVEVSQAVEDVKKSSSKWMKRQPGAVGAFSWQSGYGIFSVSHARVDAVRAYIFENAWQSFRTRRDRDLELTTATHTYAKPGRYTVAVKVIDIFGNDTMTLVPLTVG